MPKPQPRPLLCSQIPGCKVASLVPGDRAISREQADRQGGDQGHSDPTPASKCLGGHSLGPAWRPPPCTRLILDLPLSGPRVDASACLSSATSENYKLRVPGSRSQLTASSFLAIWITGDNNFPGCPTLRSRHHEPSFYKGNKRARDGGDISYQGAMRVLTQGWQKGERCLSPLLVFSYVGSEAGRGLGGPLARTCLG